MIYSENIFMKEKSIKDYFRILKRDIKNLVELKLEFYKLEFIEVFSSIFSKIFTIGFVFIFGIIFVTFLLFALAFFLGDLLDANYWGFLIVSGIFMLMVIMFMIFRNAIITNPIINSLISVLFDPTKEKIKNSAKKNKEQQNETLQ